jgi:L-ascorbate metabolism protein UlaG (beta-lactamase superfamily)
MTWLPFAVALAAAASPTEARYVANAGWLLTVEGARFLVDAPIRAGIPPYATSPAEERPRLESAQPPYDRVDAILVTHWHEDHFSPEAVAAHLRASARTRLVSSPEVVARVRAVAPDVPGERLRGVLPAPGTAVVTQVAGVAVRVLRIRHNAARRFPEQHVGFLIGDHGPVLHVGDADPTADNFALMRVLPKVDVALLPFWYLTSTASRRMVAEVIGPRRIAGMHLPPGEAPGVEARLRAAGVDAALATAPGQTLALYP